MKSKAPLSCASAESFGLIHDGRRRFKVRVFLGEKAIPKVQQKNRVTAGDARNQVVLEGLDGALRRVYLVQVGGYKLKYDSLAAHIILEAN